MHILAIDVGTSSVKAAILDIALNLPVGPIAHIHYDLDHPSAEAAEVSTEKLWDSVTAAARTAAISASGVEAVGFSCLSPGLVLLDAADRPLAPIWTHLDRRSRPSARQVWADVGEEFLATTGNRPLPGGMSVICWRQQLATDSSLLRETKHYLHVNGWLGFRLTGERFFDRANACFTGLYGTMTDQAWSERWCRYFKVEPDWLPAAVGGETTIGSLRPDVADDFGVPAGLPVKLGTADTSSAMLAAGMAEGDLLHVVGTTQVLAAFAVQPRPSAVRLTRQLGVGDAFIHVTHNPVGGAALDWMHQLCFREQSAAEFYERTIPAAIKHSTGVTLDPPYLGGDRLEIEAQKAAFRDITLTSDRLELLGAVLGAMRKRHYEALRALGMGDRFTRIFLTGGGAEVVKRLIPEYAESGVYPLEEGSLRGVGCLFGPAL
jgi:xylulokinase